MNFIEMLKQDRMRTGFADACRCGDVKRARSLLKEPAITSIDLEQSMCVAVMWKRTRVIDLLLQDRRLSLFDVIQVLCCRIKYQVLVERLLQHECIAMGQLEDALMLAVVREQSDMSAQLLRDKRLLFSNSVHPAVMKARAKWYIAHARQFNELHTELVAMVVSKKVDIRTAVFT